MRSFKELTVDLVRKPPMLFPLVALFHILMLLYIIWDDHEVPFSFLLWVQVFWMAAYTLFWLAACDLRKWGALGYFALTLISAAVYFAARNNKIDHYYVSNIFLIDGLFSFFLLFYYKKFR